MGQLGGFLKIDRVGVAERDPVQRVKDFQEFVLVRPDEEVREQGPPCPPRSERTARALTAC